MNIDSIQSSFYEDIAAVHQFVSRYDHDWRLDRGSHEVACSTCGKLRRGTVGGCLVKAAEHRASAPEKAKRALGAAIKFDTRLS